MLFESSHLRITAEHGIATLWLGFPGKLANALDLARLRELDEALQCVATIPSVRILVIRSSSPGGFCAGIRPEVVAGLSHPADRATFAWYGQQVFDRLARLDAVTLAYIDGPCLGAGLELALACDYRLCVARPTTQLGFPDRIACFGGTSRLRNLVGRRGSQLLTSGQALSGREAQALKLVDLAFCERRSRIELRSALDRLELRPLKPRQPVELVGLAAERRAFAAFISHHTPPTPPASSHNPIPPLPETIGLLGDDADAALLASDIALRGGTVVVCGNRSLVYNGIDAALARGFITPLEAEQARLRVSSADSLAEFHRAGLVFVAKGHNPFHLATTVLPRVLVCLIRAPGDVTNHLMRNNQAGAANASAWGKLETFPYPRRVVQVGFCERNRIALFPSLAVDTDATTTLAAWLKPFGREPIIFPAGRFLPQTQIQALSSAERLDFPYSDSERTSPKMSSGA
jgi:enoyl-CoA hydratase